MSLDQLRKTLEKDYGHALTREESRPTGYDVIPTGSLGLDYATGIGGYARGRIQMLYGPESVGKTTLSILSMTEAQALDKKRHVGYIDMEQTFDPKWARQLGLDTADKRFFHVYPSNSEDVSDLLRKMIRSNEFSMIWVDSIGAMVTKKATEIDAVKVSPGGNAQVITRMAQANAVFARQHHTAVCLVNQMRADFKSDWDTFAGPKNLRHALSMRLKLSRNGENLFVTIEGDKIQVGTGITVKVEENKMAPRGKTADITIINQASHAYGLVGLDRAQEALTLAIKPSINAIVQQGGGYYLLPDGNRVKGRDKVLDLLRQDLTMTEQIRARAVESVKSQVVIDEPPVPLVDIESHEEPVTA